LAILKRADLALPASTEIIDSVRLGAFGFACNKSAVLAVLRLNKTEIGIIAAHLVAYIPNLQARNEQLGQLMQTFGGRNLDYLVTFGDLNYRIERDYQTCCDRIAAGDLSTLLAADQLLQLLTSSSPLFAGFFEPGITFDPTFCFDPGTDTYDSSPKHRVPAWTDRVLIRTGTLRSAFGPCDRVVLETDAFLNVCAGRDPAGVPPTRWRTTRPSRR
jgi:hypothetical protein